MVGIGIVGIGFMGVTHFKAIDKVRGARVTAVFTRDARKLKGDWRRVKGNFGGSGGMQSMSGVNCHHSIEALLSDVSVDLVDICLPTHLHTRWALKGFEAGKNVLLEKPIALQISAADRMIREARKRNLRFMVAHVLRFFPEFRLVKEVSDAGTFGRIRAAHFKRITSKPAWKTAAEISRTGGPAIDLHIHDADFIQHLFGMPSSVTSNGLVGKHGLVEHLNTHYHFDRSPVAISAEAGWLSQQGCPFEQGYDVYFEDAVLKFNSSSGRPPVLLTNDGRRRTPRLSQRDGFVGELQEAVNSVRNGRDSATLGGVSARNSLNLCKAEIRSVQTGRKVTIKAPSRRSATGP